MISLLEEIRPSIIEQAFPDQVEDKPIYQEELADWREQNGWRILLERAPNRAKKEVADTVSATMNISGKSARSLE